MPEYLSPGVYVEEVDAGPQPIEGVSTSITGAVGVTVFGPTSGKPVLVTSFAEFMQNFGGFLPTPPSAIYNQWAPNSNVEGGQWWHFPLAVKGYFDNGGQQLYAKRVFSSTSTPATANLGNGMVSEIVSDTVANATVLQLRHLINIDDNSQVQIVRGDTGAQIGANFAVASYNQTTGRSRWQRRCRRR
jgi:phage tail sheath protein FI